MTTDNTGAAAPHRPPQICIGTICGGSVRVEYLHGLISAISAQDTPVGRVLIEPSGPYLDDARNSVVAKFLDTTKLTYLLFIDSDIYFTLDDVRAIYDFARLQHKFCIVSGAYRTERNGSYVVAGVRNFSGQIDMLTLEQFSTLRSPTVVDGVGAGFLLIPRAILTELQAIHGSPCPWFDEPIDEHGVHLGEDYGFCERVTKLGHKIFLHPDIRVTHVKPIALTLPIPEKDS